MRLLLLTLSFIIFTGLKSNAQKDIKSISKRIIYWKYDGGSLKLSSIGTPDTLEMRLYNIKDSLYFYHTEIPKYLGPSRVDFTYSQNTKIGTYIEDDMTSEWDVEDSTPIKRDTLHVQFLNFKLLEFYEKDKKYVVYRYLVNRKDVDYSNFLIFWTKEFGIIMRKDLYFSTLTRIEYLDDEETNKILRHLCYFINSDSKFNSLLN